MIRPVAPGVGAPAFEDPPEQQMSGRERRAMKLASDLRRVQLKIKAWMEKTTIPIVLLLILTPGIIYFFALVPYHTRNQPPLVYALHILVAAPIMFNTLYNYLMACFRSPGLVPDHLPDVPNWQRAIAAASHADGFSAFCKYCRRIKPPRTHHCKVCNKCILKMDHHCHYTRNCIGHRNHRNFLLFAMWLAIACLFCLVMDFGPYWLHLEDFEVPWSQYLSPLWTARIGFWLPLAFGAWQVQICMWQFWYALSNQTSIEFKHNTTVGKLKAARGEQHYNQS